MSPPKFTRRQALTAAGSLIGGSTLARAQSSPATNADSATRTVRLAPRLELVNVPEFEEMAKLTLPANVFATVASGDRSAFDRITLRPRALVPTMDLDLSIQLFGQTVNAPMLVGPIAEHKRFHRDGELATAKGAAAAKAILVVSSHSSVPLEQITAQAAGPLWYHAAADEANARAQIDRAVKAGVKAVCLSLGKPAGGATTAASSPIDWNTAKQLRQGLAVPVLVSGVATAQQATLAIQHGFDGIVVSRAPAIATAAQAPIEWLPTIADAVAGKVPVLLEGTVHRGSDIFKALALGAQAVLVSEPAIWGLAAYGPEGIESVFGLLLIELARAMGSCGRVNVKSLDRTAVRIHAART